MTVSFPVQDRATDFCKIPWLIIYLLTYLLTPWSKVLLEKLTGFQLVKKFPAFYGTRSIHIHCIHNCTPLSLSWACSINSIHPPPTSWRSILILSYHLHLGLTSGLFPSGFPTKTLYTRLLSPILATCPAHFILLAFITRKILDEVYRSSLTHKNLKTQAWNIVFRLYKHFSVYKRMKTHSSFVR